MGWVVRSLVLFSSSDRLVKVKSLTPHGKNTCSPVWRNKPLRFEVKCPQNGTAVCSERVELATFPQLLCCVSSVLNPFRANCSPVLGTSLTRRSLRNNMVDPSTMAVRPCHVARANCTLAYTNHHVAHNTGNQEAEGRDARGGARGRREGRGVRRDGGGGGSGGVGEGVGGRGAGGDTQRPNP